jgi:hypothetical protein
MHLLFLLTLAIGVVTTYIAYQSEDDITYFTATMATISFVISLILAPWQLQLLLLLAIIASARQLWLNFDIPSETEEQSDRAASPRPDPGEITQPTNQEIRQYRGIRYTLPDSNTQRTQQEIQGKYRGIPWKKEIS